MSGVIQNESSVLKNYGSRKKKEIKKRASEITEEERVLKEKLMTQLQLLDMDINNLNQSKGIKELATKMRRRLSNMKRVMSEVHIGDRVAEFSLSVEKQLDLVIGQACSLLAAMENDIGCRTVKPAMHVIERIKDGEIK